MKTAIVFGAMAAGISCAAMGNGINPPRPREAVITTATCTPRSGASDVEVLRASVTGSEQAGELVGSFDGFRSSFRIGNATAIEMPEGSVDLEGAIAGRVAFKSGDVREGKLLVRTREGNVRLAGFDAMGNRIEMDLVACRKVAFSTGTMPDSSRMEAPKK